MTTGAPRPGARCEVPAPIGAPLSDSAIAAHLIADAADIVRVRAVAMDTVLVSGSSTSTTRVRFDRLEVLKATDPIPAQLTVEPGEFTARDEFNPHAVPYTNVRPSGLAGMCFTSEYRRGAEYLLFLRRDSDGTLTPYWAALAPTNEELRGESDPWLLWVRAHRR